MPGTDPPVRRTARCGSGGRAGRHALHAVLRARERLAIHWDGVCAQMDLPETERFDAPHCH